MNRTKETKTFTVSIQSLRNGIYPFERLLQGTLHGNKQSKNETKKTTERKTTGKKKKKKKKKNNQQTNKHSARSNNGTSHINFLNYVFKTHAMLYHYTFTVQLIF